MNVAIRYRIMRIEDFLAWEARQDRKYEFDGFEPVAMAGGSINHSTIQVNLAISVGGRLRGSRCAFHGSDLKLLMARRARYPDGQVICGMHEGDETFTTSPTVIFEVVSPESETRDHVEKLAEYRTLASLRRYVLLEQDSMTATVHERAGEDWTTRTLTGDAMLGLPEVGIEVPLPDLYVGVVLAPPPDGPTD